MRTALLSYILVHVEWPQNIPVVNPSTPRGTEDNRQPTAQAHSTLSHPITEQFLSHTVITMIPEGIIAALESTVSTEYAASTIAALNLSTSGRTPISGETESASHAVENHDSSVIGECSVHSSEGTITLNSDSQYQTAVESQNEGTAGGENLATTTTDLAPRLSNTLNAHHSAIPQGVFDLTEAALMAHHCSLNVNMSLDEIQGLTRPDELLQAAREMGFELPRECLEAESRNLCDWVEAQRHIRAHDRRT